MGEHPFHRYQGARRVPKEYREIWWGMIPPDCRVKTIGARMEHFKHGWVWWKNTYTGEVWVTCKWCYDHRLAQKRKKEKQKEQHRLDVLARAEWKAAWEAAHPPRPARTGYPHITPVGDFGEPRDG